MVIRETPSHIENFIVVNNKVGDILQKNGFIPKYMDSNYLYFVKDKMLLFFMESEGLRGV